MYKIHSQARRISEFPELCGLLLGRWAEWLATAFCLLAVLGASVVYWVLMSNFFFNTVNFIHDHVTDHDNFTNASTGVFCPKDEAPHQLDDDYAEGMNSGNSTSPPSTFKQIWTMKTAPLFLVAILFPLVNFKSATLFTKFNSLGTVSILFIFGSVMFRSYEWGVNADFSNTNSTQYIPLFNSSFPSLTGI